jgi:hypothetical protein
MLAFQARGWELIAARVTEPLLRTLQQRATHVVKLDEGRYTFELPLDPPPAHILAELSAAGATLVSINPVRETLEDYFVQQVSLREAPMPGRGIDEQA